MSFSTTTRSIDAWVQDLLDALGPTQHQRLLRLHTPLGPNVLLAERMSGLEALSPRAPGSAAPAGFRFDIYALSSNAHLPLQDLMGQPVRLDLLTQASATELRPFHGHVTACSLLGSDGGLARYKLTVEPWLAFLAHRQDSWAFQDMTVPEIIDEVFVDYQGQGRLEPAWRWDLADPTAYPRRSLCSQFRESDLDFISRLMAEEGLFCWFEHEAGNSDGVGLGRHTLVIADHNGSFTPNAQAHVRFTQSASASLKEDSLTRFDEQRRITPTALSVASWNHRSLQQANAEATGDERQNSSGLQLPLRDQPGAYAYEDSTQAERIARRQLEALQAPAWQFRGTGTLRQAACATTFTLSEHPQVEASTAWVMTGVFYRARNNLSADLSTGLEQLLGAVPGGSRPAGASAAANATDEPLFEAQILAQDLGLPVRAAGRVNATGDVLFKRPQLSGTQTAIVVGRGDPVHTDRDGRIKVQFHWQRGVSSSHRLDHPAGSNAPGDAGAGTWVRVSQAWAGANWGSQQVPRLGQEVVVGFIEGDVDRPVVLGSVYNGVGQADGQGNRIGAGAATATGNAAAWFPGAARAGAHEGHQHAQVLSGHKSQSLDNSQGGAGGYNQLVLDDSAGQSRVSLGSTTAATSLQLGHLIQQNDNQRLAPRGHGLDLATAGHGALRAGAGLLLSTQAHAKGTAGSMKLSDASKVLLQLTQAMQLSRALSGTAQKHKALLKDEGAPNALPIQTSLEALIDSFQATETKGHVGATNATGAGHFMATQGGAGTVPAPSQSDLTLYGHGGAFIGTPAHSSFSAGGIVGLTAAQDVNFSSQRQMAVAVNGGLSLFTIGKATDASKPNQETGLMLHAASGSVSVQAQTSDLSLIADQSVTMLSITNNVTVSAPQHVLLSAGGSAIRISNGSITLTTASTASFNAVMKELAHGAKVSRPTVTLPVPSELHLQPTFEPHSLRFGTLGADDLLALSGWAGHPYTIVDDSGNILAKGEVGKDDRLPRITTSSAQTLRLRLGDPNGAALLPHGADWSPSNASYSLDQVDADLTPYDDVPEEGTEITHADISQVMASRYYQETAAAVNSQLDVYLSEELVADLINRSNGS